MQYIDYLTKQPSDKDAIIINGDRYTYGKLYVLVQDARARLPQVAEKHLYPIRETGILKQLVLFLACAGTNQVPVIVPADSKLEVTDPLFDTPVPERAVMAVMTSGTTGIPKILFRSFESWADFFAIQNAVFGVDADSRLFVPGKPCIYRESESLYGTACGRRHADCGGCIPAGQMGAGDGARKGERYLPDSVQVTYAASRI